MWLFIHALHPESVDCLGTHSLKYARFFGHGKDPWVSRITVRVWVLEQDPDPDSSTNPSPDTKARVICTEEGEENDEIYEDEIIRLPTGLRDALEQVNKGAWEDHKDQAKRVVLTASSIITSTNDFGEFSKTSIFSKSMTDRNLLGLGKAAEELWQKFIHQPQTGRCLVFLLFLSVLCQEMSQHYQESMTYFTNMLNLEVGCPVSSSIRGLVTADFYVLTT